MNASHFYGSKRPTCQNTSELIIEGGSDNEIVECDEIYDEIAHRPTGNYKPI